MPEVSASAAPASSSRASLDGKMEGMEGHLGCAKGKIATPWAMGRRIHMTRRPRGLFPRATKIFLWTDMIEDQLRIRPILDHPLTSSASRCSRVFNVVRHSHRAPFRVLRARKERLAARSSRAHRCLLFSPRQRGGGGR